MSLLFSTILEMIRSLFEKNPTKVSDVDKNDKYRQYEQHAIEYMVARTTRSNIPMITRHVENGQLKEQYYKIIGDDVDGPNIIPLSFYVAKRMAFDPSFTKVERHEVWVNRPPMGNRFSRVYRKIRGTVNIAGTGQPDFQTEQTFLIVDEWPVDAVVFRRPGMKVMMFDSMMAVHRKHTSK